MVVSADVADVLGPIRANRRASAVLTDFDGTLSPIVEDPATARPLPGAPEALALLSHQYGLVAVVSGRPVAFLRNHLAGAGGRVVLSGLYGLESVTGAGPVHVEPAAERWREAVARAAEEAETSAPPRVTVERKGLSVTLHWRVVPEAETWARAFAEAAATRLGLVAHPGRMTVELRPPVGVDKGSAVAGLVAGRYLAAACFLGDDAADVPAFRALERPGLYPARIAVASAETPPALLDGADAVVHGPEQALSVLDWLAQPD